MKWFCDVHRRKDDSGYRITFSSNGEEFGYVNSPTEIPASAGDKVFTDVIPISHTDAFLQLLRRGVEVHYLRRLTLVEKMRQRLGLSKSAKADVRALMSIDEKWYKKADEDFLVMRQLISDYRRLERDKQRLENQAKDAFNKESFRRLIDHIEEEQKTVAIPIIEEAEKRLPLFKVVVQELGVADDNHLLGREALAELLTYVDFSKSFRKVREYLGLFRNPKTKNMRYSHSSRKALSRLTMSLIGKDPKAEDEEAVAFKIWLTFRRETRKRLAGIPAQQQG